MTGIFPERSEGALADIDMFYRTYNDVAFYVEDEDQENLYFEILTKVFRDVKFEKIFPLGGKNNVINHAEDPNNAVMTKRVYIVDKDFDDILSNKRVVHGLVYLKRFCIENYLMERESLVEFIIESCPKLKRPDVEVALNLEDIHSRFGDELLDLFGLFYVVQRDGLGIKNCSEKPETFSNQKRLWEISPDLLRKYRERVDDEHDVKTLPRLHSEIRSDPSLQDFFSKDLDEVVSGKFIAALLFRYLKSKFPIGNITFESFVFRVAKNCELSSLSHLRDEVDMIHPQVAES